MIAAYESLSEYQLYAKNFPGALTAAEAGQTLAKTNLNLEMNRAHALLFLGRTQEADSVYLGHSAARSSNPIDMNWNRDLLRDFDELEKAGITNAQFGRIRGLLKQQTGR